MLNSFKKSVELPLNKSFSNFKGASTKTFVMLSRFWLVRGWGVWVNPLKNENLRLKSFFSDNEMLMKPDVKQQEVKELIALSYNFL